MSLVNDMLRDLEQRRSDAPAEQISWINREPSASAPHGRLLIAVILLTMVTLVLIWLLRDSFLPAQNISASLALNSVNAVPAQVPVRIPAIANQSNAVNNSSTTPLPEQTRTQTEKTLTELTALDSEFVDNGLSITLQFSHAVSYETETRSNLLRLRFAAVQQTGAIVLPEIPSELAILQLIDQGQELVLTLQTRNAVSYQLRRVDDKTLLISLTGLPINSYVETQNNSAVQRTASLQEKNNTGERDEDASVMVAPTTPLTDVADPKRERRLTPEQQDRQITRQAQQQLRNGERGKARQTLTDYVNQYPHYAKQTGHLLASLMLESGEQANAFSLLTTLRQSLPGDIPLRQLQAQVLLTQNKSAEALQLLRDAAPPIRGNATYYEVLAATAQKTGDTALAIQTYQRLLLIDQQRGDWWIGLAIALDSSQQALRANEAYRKALTDRQLAPALRQYARQRLGQLSTSNSISNQ